MSILNSPLFMNSFLGFAIKKTQADPTFLSGSNNAQDPKYNPDDPEAPTPGPTGGVSPRGLFGTRMPFTPGSYGTTYRQPISGFGNTNTVLEAPNSGIAANNIPEFEQGGLMTEDGRAIPPPPSAGIGRTLPSARFKVEPTTPPNIPTLPQNMPDLGAPGGQMLPPEDLHENVESANPEALQKVRAVVLQAMQSGQLTDRELNMLVQLAKLAVDNPNAWQQIRKFAIKNGLGTEADIPQQYDQGLVFTLLIIGKSLQQSGVAGAGAQGGDAMMGQGPSPQQTPQAGLLPSYSDGGPTGDKAHIAKLHPREFVFPEKAVMHYGLDKLNKMVAAVSDDPTT